MALYEYRCERDGTFEIVRPLGEAPPSSECPVCRDDARRVFSSPILKTMPRALVAALDHECKTRDSPDIVTSIPSSGARRPARMAPLTPALRRLPRP